MAREAALLSSAATALDVADLADRLRWPLAPAAAIHSALGAAFGLDSLRATAGSMHLEQHWDRLVVRRAAEDFAEIQRTLGEAAAHAAGAPPKSVTGEWAAKTVQDWIAAVGQPAQRARATFDELNAQGQWTFAKLMLIAAEFNALAGAAR
jgi:glutamate dehydrogenase